MVNDVTYEYRKATEPNKVKLNHLEVVECKLTYLNKELKNNYVNGRLYHTSDTNQFFYDWNGERHELNWFGKSSSIDDATLNEALSGIRQDIEDLQNEISFTDEDRNLLNSVKALIEGLDVEAITSAVEKINEFDNTVDDAISRAETEIGGSVNEAITNADIAGKVNTAIENADIESKVDESITNADIAGKVNTAIENANIADKINQEITNADIAGKVNTEIENADIDSKVNESITNADIAGKVNSAIEDVNIDSKVNESITNADITGKVNTAIENVDIDSKVNESITNADIAGKVETEITNANIEDKVSTSITDEINKTDGAFATAINEAKNDISDKVDEAVTTKVNEVTGENGSLTTAVNNGVSTVNSAVEDATKTGGTIETAINTAITNADIEGKVDTVIEEKLGEISNDKTIRIYANYEWVGSMTSYDVVLDDNYSITQEIIINLEDDGSYTNLEDGKHFTIDVPSGYEVVLKYWDVDEEVYKDEGIAIGSPMSTESITVWGKSYTRYARTGEYIYQPSKYELTINKITE